MLSVVKLMILVHGAAKRWWLLFDICVVWLQQVEVGSIEVYDVARLQESKWDFRLIRQVDEQVFRTKCGCRVVQVCSYVIGMPEVWNWEWRLLYELRSAKLFEIVLQSMQEESENCLTFYCLDALIELILSTGMHFKRSRFVLLDWTLDMYTGTMRLLFFWQYYIEFGYFLCLCHSGHIFFPGCILKLNVFDGSDKYIENYRSVLYSDNNVEEASKKTILNLICEKINKD